MKIAYGKNETLFFLLKKDKRNVRKQKKKMVFNKT